MSSLAEIILAEADVVSAFVLLLQEEQEALKSGNADALPALIERKTVVTGKLAPFSNGRNDILTRAGFNTDRPGIEAWLTKYPNDNAVRHSWEKLQSLAAEARELNRLNGELIRLHMQSNAHALEALLSSANRQDLYSADGQSSTGTTRRIIDSA